MDFIRETILTFSLKDKEEFERFMSRKQLKDQRKDVLVFSILYKAYVENSSKDDFKGDQNYHAIRKRISKELVSFLILKKSSTKQSSVDSRLLMIQYFIDLGRFNVAWELLQKEEKSSKNASIEAQLKIEQTKLLVLPYYASEFFEETKKRITYLQKVQIRKLQFQLSFIQIQKELKDKMTKGEVDFSDGLIENVFKEYVDINEGVMTPVEYLRLIEVIRGEYLVQRKYKLFASIVQKYYDIIKERFTEKELTLNISAQLEYIMAHAYFRVRNFSIAQSHIVKLGEIISKDSDLKIKFTSRYISLKSAIDVFENKLNEAIAGHEEFVESSNSRLTLKEQLNIALNLVAYYCVDEQYRKANRILIRMNQSDSYYKKHMGREWLIRKELIRTLIQVELKNEEIAISILGNLKKKHKDMFAIEQYKMVVYYINTFLEFLNNPYQASEEDIVKMEKQTNFQKENLFDDPKLLSFYVWLKSKITKQNLYELLKKEYRLLS